MSRKIMNGLDLQSQRIVSLADPSSATDAVNKQYVDGLVNGLAWKDEVAVATTTSGTLASDFENGDTIDGVTLVTGMRLLVKDQADPTENGIRIVAASGAPARSTDADSTTDLNNATVRVNAGTVNAGRSYTQTTVSPTVGSSNIVWTRNDVGTSYTAGTGLNESPAGTFNVTNSDGSITVGADTVSLASQVAGAGLTLAAGVLDVVGDASITVGANSLGLATGVAGAGLTLTTGVLAVVGTSGGGITVNANDLGVDSTVARVFQTGTHASTTSIAITHSLGKQFVCAHVYVTSTRGRDRPRRYSHINHSDDVHVRRGSHAEHFDFRNPRVGDTVREVGENFGMPSRTNNPASPANGDLWLRSDLNKARARINGVSENLATETYTLGPAATIPYVTAGRYYWPNGSGTLTAATPTAHTMVLTPLYLNYTGSITNLAWEVTTQGNSVSGTDHLRIGLYASDAGGLPTGAALFDSGQQNLEVAPGVKTMSVSWTGITPKLYWLARVRQTTGTIATAAQLRLLTPVAHLGHFISDANGTPVIGANPPTGFQQTGVTGALPSIATIAVSVLVPAVVLVLPN